MSLVSLSCEMGWLGPLGSLSPEGAWESPKHDKVAAQGKRASAHQSGWGQGGLEQTQ